VPEKLKTNDIASNNMVEIPIVVPIETDTTISDINRLIGNGIFSRSYEKLTACTQLRLRFWKCKYKIGCLPSIKERQKISDMNRELLINDSFLFVDTSEECAIDEDKNDNSNSETKLSASQTALTVILKFPMFMILFFFIACYDVVFDSHFRNQIRKTIRWDIDTHPM
tara:strand:+ start:881 stop:1384 length:504 start_codon:yes stop_codon:yes gene_type:complete